MVLKYRDSFTFTVLCNYVLCVCSTDLCHLEVRIEARLLQTRVHTHQQFTGFMALPLTAANFSPATGCAQQLANTSSVLITLMC
jgi:hypothetical protein